MRRTFLPAIAIVLAAAPAAAGEPQAFEEAARHAAAGRFDLALEALDRVPSGAAEAPGTRVEALRARCLFELGDYPACEASLRAILPGCEPGSDEEVECLARLARVLSFQDVHAEALEVLDRAIGKRDAPALRRLAIALCLRACRYGEVGAHAKALLAAAPADGFAHFALGIAAARQGRLGEALEDLRKGLDDPGSRRDARFELALTLGKLGRPAEALPHLLEIVAEDPFDAEACHQASRQLLRLRTREASRTAAVLVRYFESLQEALGLSTRDQHMQAAGQAASAALLRAARWERVGAFDRAIEELRRGLALGRGSAGPSLLAADFWARAGLLAEAEAILGQLSGASGGTPEAPEVAKARERIAARREEIRTKGVDPLTRARLDLAGVRWKDAGPALNSLIEKAAAAGDFDLADRAARLHLALDPTSASALERLVSRTADPALLAPHIHYLSRLAALRPERRKDLDAARDLFLGKGDSAR
jgi:tetratricopeptide (TPR) repeat protein